MTNFQRAFITRVLSAFRKAQSLSHWFERRLTPAGSLVMGTLIAGAIFGIDTRISLAHIIFALAFSLLLVSFSARGRIEQNIQFTRHLPQFVTVGAPRRYTISVQNLSTHPVTGLTLQERLQQRYPRPDEFFALRNSRSPSLRENWFDQLVGYPKWLEELRNLRAVTITPAPIPQLLPGQEVNIDLELTPIHRGVAQFAYFGITRNDPLGLWRAIRDIPGSESLAVLPRIYPVQWPNFSGRRQHQSGGISQASRVGDSEEFRSLRDYRPGDPLRAIHWRSWARTGHPVVKEYQEEYFSRYALILDTARINYIDEIFEAMIAIAASFTVAQPGADSLFDLLFIANASPQFTDVVQKITLGRGVGATETALRILAGVQPSPPGYFPSLAQTVLSHIQIMSGAIIIFQCWDKTRANFIAQLQAYKIAMKIYAPEQLILDSDCPFPQEGQLITPSRLREILL